jgi:hypothetical protein
VSCDFDLGSSVGRSFDRVNLRVTGDDGGSLGLLNVGDASACAGDPGWYYVLDASGVPSQLSVCPATCNELQDERVRVDLEIGCETRIR